MTHPYEWIILNHKNSSYKDLQTACEATPHKVLSEIKYYF